MAGLWKKSERLSLHFKGHIWHILKLQYKNPFARIMSNKIVINYIFCVLTSICCRIVNVLLIVYNTMIPSIISNKVFNYNKVIATGEHLGFAMSWVNNRDIYLWPVHLFIQICTWLCLSFADSWAQSINTLDILSHTSFFPVSVYLCLSCCFDMGLRRWDSTCFSFLVLPGREWGNSYSEVGRSVVLIKNNWSLFN